MARITCACFIFCQDEDRIFTNLYGRHDWKLAGAIQRVKVSAISGVLYLPSLNPNKVQMSDSMSCFFLMILG